MKNQGADEGDFDDISKDKRKLKSDNWQVADVNFGLSTMISTEYLSKLAAIRSEFIMNNIRIELSKNEKDI